MMSFRVSPKAERDLQEIGDYIAFDNPTRALSFIEEIEKRFTEIAQHPELYRRRDEIFFGIRATSHGKYMIFFTIADDGIVDFVRVLHGARNITAIVNDGGFH
jgi:toxin ParE1/3/4